MRERFADLIDWVAIRLFLAAHWLRPEDDRPRCPDCQIGPDLGPDEECPVCREQWELQRNYEDAAHAGYEQGFDHGYDAGYRGAAW
jgi:hypothetical protein